MLAVDTNLLVRLLVRDDAAQVATAEALIEKGAWLSHLVLTETLWVLDAVYERTPSQIAKATELLLNHKHLTLQEAEVVKLALQHFRARPKLGFSDCLVLETARKAGH
jgi:predicted nucleic-acid-binding protein